MTVTPYKSCIPTCIKNQHNLQCPFLGAREEGLRYGVNIKSTLPKGEGVSSRAKQHLRCRRLRLNESHEVFTVTPVFVMPYMSGRVDVELLSIVSRNGEKIRRAGVSSRAT